MDLRTYSITLQTHWHLVAFVTLVSMLAAFGVELAAPPRYSASGRLLVLLDEPARVDIEDALAYDVPAIVRGQPFAHDVAQALAQQGIQLQADDVRRALSATNQKREVTLTATGTDPALVVALVQAAITQLQTGGLRYWQNGAPVAERPGLTLTVLEAPALAVRANGPATQARNVAIRTLAGLCAGLALVALQWYGTQAWQAWRTQPSE